MTKVQTFAVNTNLKSLFDEQSSGFNFGDKAGEFIENDNIQTEGTEQVSLVPQVAFNNTKLFFFHFGAEGSIKQRSMLRKGIQLFQRSETVEEITHKWDTRKDEMTNEFKRKHKSASKRKQKMKKGVGRT